MKLPNWMTRRIALTVLILGLIFFVLGLLAYGTEAIGSWCENGKPSNSTGSGSCSWNGGVDEDRGVNGLRTVDTILGWRTSWWVGVTKWPALLLGASGAVSGVLGVGATSTLAISSTKKRDEAGPKPIEELDIFADDYLELAVKIDERPKGYSVEVTTPMGQSFRVLHNMALPQDRGMEELAELASEPSRLRFGSRQDKAVAAFGTNLFNALFSGATAKAFRDSIDFVRSHNAVLRIVLQVDEPFADIPWEYLYDPERGSFLSRSQETSLVRLLPTTHATRQQSDIGVLRVLSMAASPREAAQLDIADEQKHIRHALAPGVEAGKVVVEFVAGSTLSCLNDALRNFQPHVFHFAGHGDWDSDRDDGVILLEDSAGFANRVTGIDLGTLLNQSNLRLAIFNSCHAAIPSKRDRFAGITSSLVAQGVPAAVGMQFAFDDKAAITFSSELLRELGEGAPLDKAVTEARISVFSKTKGIDWGTPVLTTRTDLDDVLPASHRGTTHARA